MAARDQIISFLGDLLRPGDFDDIAPNGLQVPGAEQVERVATGVSAHLELFRQASKHDAQLILVHHGLFWDFLPRALTPHMKARLDALFKANISLAAYHLPLDAHGEVGNAALLCKLLGFSVEATPFGHYRGQAVGAIGHLEHGLPIKELLATIEANSGQPPLVFHEGPHKVRRIGVVSGAGASSFSEAVGHGLDAFLTGEPAEHAMALAREAGVHFIAAGHYNTEKPGVRRLGDLVAERFKIDHVFLDVPNPV